MAQLNEAQVTKQVIENTNDKPRYAPKDILSGKEQFKVLVMTGGRNVKTGKSALRFQWYLNHLGASVADVLKASTAWKKGESTEPAPTKDDLRWDLAHGHITLKSE